MKKDLLLRVLRIGGILVLLSADGAAATGNDTLGPADIVSSTDQKYLFIACWDGSQVLKFDVSGNQVLERFPLPGKPTGLRLCPSGRYLFVTWGGPTGRIAVIDTRSDEIISTIPSGHTPMSPVVSPDGKRLYVCNRFDHTVSVIDLQTHQCIRQIAVAREPVAADITPDGKYLVVANHLPVGIANKGFIAAEVSVIDTDQYRVHRIGLPNGATGLRGVYVAPGGGHAYVTFSLARYPLPTTHLERGWINTNALGIIDLRRLELLNTVLLDNVTLGAANPWGVSGSADGKAICVTHAGTHEVSVIDQAGLLKKLQAIAKTGSGEAAGRYGDVPNDLRFLVGLRRRLKLAGNGPRGLAMVGTKVYVAEYFTDSLGVIDINNEMHAKARSIDLGGKKTPGMVRKGEMLFHDASLCFQQWQSCVSCHPDGRADTLNWDLLNDGIGNPKNTKSMLLAHKTPPAMATGARENAQAAVRAGLRSILFVVRPEEDAQAIDAYLQSLNPVPSPYLKNGRLSAAAERGKRLFFSARVGCAHCHSGPYYTDLKPYDVGTHTPADFTTNKMGRREPLKKFDNPTLIEVWRTGPYLHDGRAATIKEVLTICNQKDRHGTISILTDQEIKDLVEFTLSL